jgi:5-formyltetrahydrofolate cyclo-ligase
MKGKKIKLRRYALSLRRSLSPEEIQEKSEKIWQSLSNLPLFTQAGVVLFYIALPDEVQTDKMIQITLKMGRRVAVPVVDLSTKEIIPFEIKSPQAKLVPGPFGVLQPGEEDRYPISLEEIDLVIVPGVAFDPQGRRLGFGAGFYDRFLRRLSFHTKFIALAFECQLIDEVPCEEFDVSVDYIITEKSLIYCHKRGDKSVS